MSFKASSAHAAEIIAFVEAIAGMIFLTTPCNQEYKCQCPLNINNFVLPDSKIYTTEQIIKLYLVIRMRIQINWPEGI